MTTAELTSLKADLHQYIEQLPPEELRALWEWLCADDTLTSEEEERLLEARAAMERGDFVTREEFERKYDL
ncbi:MAG: hypothetical protein HY875_10215 [Chloroflexi bacterium]|nr:hypothetical protein [Chloroflexota bacterium]